MSMHKELPTEMLAFFFFEISTDTLPEFLSVVTFAGRVTQHSQWTHTEQMNWYVIVFFFWLRRWKPPFTLGRITSRIRKYTRTITFDDLKNCFQHHLQVGNGTFWRDSECEMPGIRMTFLCDISRSQWSSGRVAKAKVCLCLFRSMSGTGEAQWSESKRRRSSGRTQVVFVLPRCSGCRWRSNRAADKMVQRFKETSHLVFKSISALSRGTLKQKEPEAPFTSMEAVNTELLIQTRTHSVNQLSIFGTVDDLSAIRLDRRKGTSQFLCGQEDVDQVYLLVSSPTMALGNRMRGNVSSFDSLISINTAHSILR